MGGILKVFEFTAIKADSSWYEGGSCTLVSSSLIEESCIGSC